MQTQQGQGEIPEEEYDQLENPYSAGQTVNQDNSFMKWLFDFRKQVVDPLRKSWRGYEYNPDTDLWEVPKGGLDPIMNNKGITWSISLIESYISPVFIVSNFDANYMNYVMRETIKGVIKNLCKRHKEFGLNKLDISRVKNEIESKILAILLGARGDGYRTFFAKQYHVQETIGRNDGLQRRQSSLLGGITSIFKKNNN